VSEPNVSQSNVTVTTSTIVVYDYSTAHMRYAPEWERVSFSADADCNGDPKVAE
jgi:hypothetical protein